jgi:hypothetical protein
MSCATRRSRYGVSSTSRRSSPTSSAWRPRAEISVDADLERARPELVQTLGLRTALQVERYVRENRAVPEAECLLRDGRGTRIVTTGQRLSGLLRERLEDLRVENGSTEVDPVTAPPSLDGNPVRGESPAEPGHV